MPKTYDWAFRPNATPPGSACRVGVVIPCYKVKDQILAVLQAIGTEVDRIYLVDDKCPDGTGHFVEQEVRDPRLRVLFHEVNRGVGGAVMTGMSAALVDDIQVIVKIDGDGQMDPSLIPLFIRPILAGEADVTKGNRFFDPDDVRAMPVIRLLGNAALSFLTKLSSGYWNLFDPTNGYIAWDSRLLAVVPFEKIEERYFFESDLLFRIGLIRAKVIDIPMEAVYGDEVSNLKIFRVIVPFLYRNSRNFVKRIFYNYFLRDFNVASLEFVFGLILCLFGSIYGLIYWGNPAPATAGRVMLAALPFLTGVILLLSFVNFDIQQLPREPISRLLDRRRVHFSVRKRLSS
jgi:glycosyltransferase involved in cell wall biosynthesis